MQTETANNSSAWNASRARQRPLARLFDLRLGMVLLLALLAGGMAYQARPAATIQVGWLGDQLFLPSSQGLGDTEAQAGRWFGDELNVTSPTQRARWTRNRALVTLPGLGARRDLTLTMFAQGWPSDAVRSAANAAQPTVVVRANGVLLAPFTATADWREHRLVIPATALSGGDLQLEFTTPTFTATQTSNDDPRAKGIRVAQISVVGSEGIGWFAAPPPTPLALLLAFVLLGYLTLALIFRRPTLAFVLAIALASGAALGLALARIWAVALLPWLIGAVLLVLLAYCWPAVSSTAARFAAAYARGSALTIGLGAALLAWLAYLLVFHAGGVSSGITWKQVTAGLPDTLLLAALGVSLLLLLALHGPVALGGATRAIVAAISSRRGALIMLGVFGAVWLGYEAWMLATLPGVGHADYADNAVVARNLVRGRGWVVDYVTQFYQLYPSLTRPQETWPIMQPVWIAPFFALLGVGDFAARLPNLLFTTALGALVYWFGARVWDRRVGLVAAILLLTNYLFFLLVINATSDLAFVVFSFAALALVYWWGTGDRGQGTGDRGQVYWLASGAGVLTGLMLLQKPANGAFTALGMGVWLLAQVWRARPQADAGRRMAWRLLARRLAPIATWALIALLILSPYLVRNLATFGKLFYSTESRDAWVSGYDADSEAIYKVYTPEYGLSETKGLPERSWLLRSGFDRTLAKIADQVAAVRNYLVPPWRNLPLGLSAVLSGAKDGPSPIDPLHNDSRLLFGMGAWLALLGTLLALRRCSALIRLLMLAFAPYTLFLVLYWHADEPRYFVALMPWIALLAAVAIWSIYDRFAHAGSRWAPVGLLLALVLALGVVSPSWPAIEQKIEEWHRADSDRVTYDWLEQHTAHDAVVMTRVPWQLNWHSDRSALMIPYTIKRVKFLQLARYYHARYLVFDVGTRPDTKFVQPFLQKMVDDRTLGFKVAYTSPVLYDKHPTIVYEFPADYGGVPELRP